MKIDKRKTTIPNFSTLDAYLAGFLTLKGHTHTLINQDGKIVFLFNLTDSLQKDIEDFQNGAVVEASKFVFAIKTLKSQIHTKRRENEHAKTRNYFNH